ncbi:MAG: hypothetical protein ACFFCO_12000 [Promethearchaeota archaeon]
MSESKAPFNWGSPIIAVLFIVWGAVWYIFQTELLGKLLSGFFIVFGLGYLLVYGCAILLNRRSAM